VIKQEEEVIGRIIEATLENARCEFDSSAKEGEAVTFKVGDEIIRARVDVLQTIPSEGLVGYIHFKDRPTRPPKYLTPINRSVEEETGILEIGHDFRGNLIKIDVNPLFLHVLLGGKTQQGKTHLLLILIEELAKFNVPAVVFDTQGEFVKAPENFKNVIVVEDINTRDLIAYLQARKIIIINMLGASNSHKAMQLSIILEKFVENKEADYAAAENDYRLLTIPPTLLLIDEADIFAPEKAYRGRDFDRSTAILEEIAKRGSKLGIGLVLAVQKLHRISGDVRDNCNSAICFHLTGRSNQMAIRNLTYFPVAVMQKLKSFLKGECIIVGALGSRSIKTRELITERSKNTDFEEMLGIEGEKLTNMQRIVVTEKGAVIDTQFGEIKSEAQNLVDKDTKAFQQSKGDGILKRETPLTDEELEKLIEKEVEYDWGGNEEEDGVESVLPFKTHLTKEDHELIKKLREVNEGNNL